MFKSAAMLTLAVAASVSALSTPEILSERPALGKWDGYTYDQFLADFNKNLQSSSEYNARKAIFEKNLELIKEHNSQNRSWWMTVTQFADQSEDEFTNMLGRVKPSFETTQILKANPLNVIRSKVYSQVTPEFTKTVPAAVDNNKHMSGIKTQGRCGSCWANAAAGALEGQNHIKYGKHQTFSTQQLTSCVYDPKHCGGTGGCSGSTELKAYEYLMGVKGLTTEEAYPYTSGNGDSGQCIFKDNMPIAARVFGATLLPANNQESLIKAVATPYVLTVSVAASSWALYGGGIFTGCTERSDFVTNHAVVIVGYSEDYYQIANSWGPKWGSNGTMFLKRRLVNETCGVNNEPWSGSACDGDTEPIVVCGECGILSESTLALLM